MTLAHWAAVPIILYSFNAFTILVELISAPGLLLVFATPLYLFVIIIKTVIKYRCPGCRPFNSMHPIDELRNLGNHQPINLRTDAQNPSAARIVRMFNAARAEKRFSQGRTTVLAAHNFTLKTG